MDKQSVKVVLTTQAGFSVTADDAVKNGQGTSAYHALVSARDVRVEDGTKITYVPVQAVDHAEITFTMSTVADPADDTCPVPATEPTP